MKHDLVDAIVVLPTNMLYNTGIATYVWILDSTKPVERIGKVQLIDCTSFVSKMRRNLGAKNRKVLVVDRAVMVKLYDDYAETEHSKVFPTETFGYWTHRRSPAAGRFGQSGI